MSQENVEVVRLFMEHANRTGGEPLWEVLDPEIEWTIDPTGLLAGTYRGHKGVKEFFERLQESFDETHVEIDDLIDAGDSVVLLCRIRNHGRSSGMTVEQPTGWVSEVREGRIVRSRVYFRPAEALEAVGLSEQDAPADS
jgi:ketosteroid isomerase-like protein